MNDAQIPNTTSQLLNTDETTTGADVTHKQTIGSLELLEERAVVNKERLEVGKIIAEKQIRTKTVNVPVELVEEVLVLKTQYYDANSQALLTGEYREEDVIRHLEPTLASRPTLLINGQAVELSDTPIEIVLSRQTAVINKETHVIQEVAIEKTAHKHIDHISVTLRHEELDVKEEGFIQHNIK